MNVYLIFSVICICIRLYAYFFMRAVVNILDTCKWMHAYNVEYIQCFSPLKYTLLLKLFRPQLGLQALTKNTLPSEIYVHKYPLKFYNIAPIP